MKSFHNASFRAEDIPKNDFKKFSFWLALFTQVEDRLESRASKAS